MSGNLTPVSPSAQIGVFAGPGWFARGPLWIRLAIRELRVTSVDLAIFVGCIALGVMAITAVGALSDGLKEGLSRQGQVLLGGDLAFVRPNARATEPEFARLSQLGRLSETATLRTIARVPNQTVQALAEVKGVDQGYPLAGAVALEGARDLATALTGDGVVVDPLLLDRLGSTLGSKLKIGEAIVTVAARLTSEPDAVGDRATFGPRVLMSMATLERTGLIQPGSLIRWRYSAAISNGRAILTPESLKVLLDSVKNDLPEAGFTIADRFDPSPQLSRTLERLRQFLTLIGLAALLVGGVGVANAVATFIDKRRRVIATMKSLGAPRGLIFRIFLAQVVAVTVVGIIFGLLLGSIIPPIVARTYASALPFDVAFELSPWTILTAVVYGLLVALLYSLWPLGRADQISPSVLFREDVASDITQPNRAVIGSTIAIGLALLGFAIATSDAKIVAASFCCGMAIVLAVFYGAGRLAPRLARALPRSRRPEMSLAIGSIASPGGLAGSVLASLGIGLSLLIAIALVDASLEAELSERLPQNAPAYFVLDLSKSDLASFTNLVAETVPGSSVVSAPMLRGRLVAIKDTPVEQVKIAPEAAWVLNGDRGLTFADDVPVGSKIIQGAWWPSGYSGEPLVSFEAELARQLGVGLGDSVTVNVLGRNLKARIASLREVKWDSLALNFVMIYSRNALESAPYKLLATVSLPKSFAPDAEVRLATAMGRAYPTITPIRVKDAIAQFNTVLAKVLTAVRIASGVTLLAGALVLAGALATAQRRRVLDAVILKALGVTSRRILISHALEYGMLAVAAAVVASVLGALAAWLTVNRGLHVGFVFSPLAILEAVGLAVALAVAFGGIGTWAVLRAPAVNILKSD